MRKPIIIGNWKMYKNINETKDFILQVEQKMMNQNIDVGIAVSFPLLETSIREASKLIISAQNCHFENDGAFTGEVSPLLLKTMNVSYVVLGHSERRILFNESNKIINKKVLKALENNLKIILCCGETEEEYINKQTEVVVSQQLKIALENVSEKQLEQIVIAYEPVWAIGTGKTATVEVAQQVCQFIRKNIMEIYNVALSNKIRIQYGGSVKPDNIKALLEQPDIDGALVGGASLQVDSFLQLIS